VGYKEVTGWGGEVTTLPFIEGHSSTKIIDRLQPAE
ncbi:MAG: bifunctional ADP-heptose synthase (sugar kinase/adenylyltransferase), partial [Neolewinella sp.]